ncbi:hypothetical protein BDW27_12063, partial [Nocardiopsis sp. L17-MgMaSL7]
WGEAAAGTDYGWVRDVGSAVWDFGVGAVEGVGAAVGAHSSQGWFAQSWGDSLKEYHWGNLTSAASLVGMYDAESDSLGWAGLSSAGEAWKDLAHSVVPWEEWGERPGYVIGTALLNIGATVGGAVLTATGVGAVVGVPLMAWRGAAILDGMGSSNRGGGGVDLPDISDIPTYGGNGAPVVNIDTSGFSPTQAAQVTASLDRLNTTSSGSGSSGESGSGGGRPVSARQHTEPTGGDLNRADRVSQNTSNREGDSGDGSRKNDTEKPPNWASGSGDSVDIRPNRSGSEPEPALVSSRNDGDVLTESKKAPAPASVRANATDIDAPGSGSRSGNEIADVTRGDRGADVQDNKNNAQNQNEENPPSQKENPDREPHVQREDGQGSHDGDTGETKKAGGNQEISEQNNDRGKGQGSDNSANESSGGEGFNRPNDTPNVSQALGDPNLDRSGIGENDGWGDKIIPDPTPDSLEKLRNGRVLGTLTGNLGRDAFGRIDSVDGRPLKDWQADMTKNRGEEIRKYVEAFREANIDNKKIYGPAMFGKSGGQVTSIVIDRVSGSVFEGINGGKKSTIPESALTQLIGDRVEAMRDPGQGYRIYSSPGSDPRFHEFPFDDHPLRHAEVKAANKAAELRADLKMEDLMGDNRFSMKDEAKGQTPAIAPCCANCTHILGGMETPRVGKNTRTPFDPTNQRIDQDAGSMRWEERYSTEQAQIELSYRKSQESKGR